MLTSSPEGVPVLEKRGDVQRRFVLALGLVALVGLIFILVSRSGTSDKVVGAGSTFAYPLIQRASTAYQTARADGSDWTPGSTGVDYEPVGSLGGIERLSDPEVDFAVSDYPLSPEAAQKGGFVQFPIVVGGLAPVYNLGAAASPAVRLDGAVLSEIFLGRVTNWSDAKIKALNPGMALPDLKITVVHRDDGSGSTLHWTRYLAAGGPDWQAGPGVGTKVKWPVGQGVRGSDKMAETVKATAGAIGYLEAGQARRAGLAAAMVAGAGGQFLSVTPASLEAAARGADWADTAKALGGGNAEAYPITTAVYVIMKRENAAARDNQRALGFLSFMLDKQGEEARRLGYLPLPAGAIADVKKIWAADLGHKS